MPLYSQLEGTGSSVGTVEGSAGARCSSSSSSSLILLNILIIVVIIRCLHYLIVHPVGDGEASADRVDLHRFLLLLIKSLSVISYGTQFIIDRVSACTARQMVFSSPWLTAKKESGSPLQTALVCNSNPLIALASPEQTATGKDMSNPLYGCDGLPKTVRVFQFTLDSRSEKLDWFLLHQDWKLLFFDVAVSFDSAVRDVHAVSFDATVMDVAATVSAACIVDAGYIVSAGICDAAGSFDLAKENLELRTSSPSLWEDDGLFGQKLQTISVVSAVRTFRHISFMLIALSRSADNQVAFPDDYVYAGHVLVLADSDRNL
ncbi:hypothetical protein Tco_0555548 [Tanacetum coccineum]